MAADDKSDHYWRNVLNGAWSNTLHRVGWDTNKVILAAAAFIGSLILGGFVFSATAGFLIGIAILAPAIFVWGIIQTQAKMYRELAEKQSTPTFAPATSITTATNHLADPRPDFAMWRHREKLTLLEAAQLWAGVRPNPMWGTRGKVNDTYAMLTGAIQKGDLPFIPDSSIDPHSRDTVRQMQQRKPHQDTQLTRTGLRAFATKHGYDPEFLRD